MIEGQPLIALHTNVPVYAEGIAPLARDAHKPAVARELLAFLPTEQAMVQVLGELFRILVGKGGRSRVAARASIMTWRDGYATQATTQATMLAATDLAADHDLSIWNAVILAASADAGAASRLRER